MAVDDSSQQQSVLLSVYQVYRERKLLEWTLVLTTAECPQHLSSVGELESQNLHIPGTGSMYSFLNPG
jgi:hypothetical protein